MHGYLKRANTFYLALAFIFLTHRFFFDIYRLMAFQAVPFDDYAAYLLSFVTDNEAAFRGPWGYRVLPVLASVPIYFVMPLYKFSNLEPSLYTDEYLRAMASIAAMSYLSIVGSMVMVFRISTERLGSPFLPSIAASLAVFPALRFIAWGSVDTFSVLYIFVLIYFIENRRVFLPLMFLSVLVNEKVAIVFMAFWAVRSLADRDAFIKAYWPQVVSAFIAFGLYFCMKAVVGLPEIRRTDLPVMAVSLVLSLKHTMTVKGMVTNIIPLAFAVILALIPGNARGRRLLREPYNGRYDFLLPLMMFVVSGLFQGFYNMGRIAAYSLPFFLPYLSIVLERIEASERASGGPLPPGDG